MPMVTARLERGPLRRRLVLAGPADDFQQRELIRHAIETGALGELDRIVAMLARRPEATDLARRVGLGDRLRHRGNSSGGADAASFGPLALLAVAALSGAFAPALRCIITTPAATASCSDPQKRPFTSMRHGARSPSSRTRSPRSARRRTLPA